MDEQLAPTVRLRRILQQRLEALERAGVTHLPRRAGAPLASIDVSGAPSPISLSQPVTDLTSDATPVPSPSSLPPDDRISALRVLQEEVAGCTLCPALAKTRTQTVFGVGNPNPRVVFMGEAPGYDEDKQGEPFVGAAGQLLTKIIENGMRMKRSDVYILNTLKCRPPNNRTPAPDEVANCRGFFEQQLDILRPEYIVCLGAVAAQNLLQTTQSVGKLRGRFYEYRGIKVLVTYHPAYLLRSPDEKRKTWEDLKFLMRDMGLEAP
jgi:DNA polymerase